MARVRYITAPVSNNHGTEAQHNSAFAVPYFECVSPDTRQERKELTPSFGPGKGYTWKNDDDVLSWKTSMAGNLYDTNKDRGFRLRANNGNVHDAFVELGYMKYGGVDFGRCMYWTIASSLNSNDGIKGCSFRLNSDTHGYGGTNNDSTNRFRHNTWLRSLAIGILGVRANNDLPEYESSTRWWGSDAICVDGDDAVGGMFVNLNFTNDMFSEATRLRGLGFMPLCSSIVFQLWTGLRSGINSGSTDSTLSIYDFKMKYSFSPESANLDKCLLLPAWSHTPHDHFGSNLFAPSGSRYNHHVRMGFEG